MTKTNRWVIEYNYQIPWEDGECEWDTKTETYKTESDARAVFDKLQASCEYPIIRLYKYTEWWLNGCKEDWDRELIEELS